MCTENTDFLGDNRIKCSLHTLVMAALTFAMLGFLFGFAAGTKLSEDHELTLWCRYHSPPGISQDECVNRGAQKTWQRPLRRNAQ